ncbi:helix-turn-helix and ligand-binding sensor domain-containing protein [Polaribacter sargassicola]|uniref:helix-turn-helix and ligand-binding sensor domain-containing protein n=1 Tax=Polaribacter sargassicola TaxID=2836891 RepID=UPI001F017BB7|nr:triple tyrosine motif-containing protein [Polaribacter sp. DS7-9]MCG1037768.1 LuxR family transcriptional regulator [Polaribacter sp. DS7-9]
MYKGLFILFFTMLSYSCFGQELPPINTYTAKEYKAENQNWAISQAKNKFIYVANNKGLLEFNGANWQLYPTPNETIMRSVKVVNDKIYTGFYMDFGFWKKNNYGELEFTSIVKSEGIKMLEDEQVWNILEVDNWIIFKTLERIYLYNVATKEVKIINSDYRLHKLSKVKGVIYFQEENKGVFKIEHGVAKLVSDHQILKDGVVVEFFSQGDEILVLTQKSGFFYLKNNQLVKWETPSESILNKVTIYSAKLLKNNDYALGTISDGFIYLKSNGVIDYQITQSSGLNNNTLLSVFEDVDNNIWLGLDNGINCVNNSSPIKIHTNKVNFIGTIYASVLYKEKLYLGTNQGLFYRNQNSDDAFKLVKNTQGQVWSLSVIDNQLFCGHTSGTFLVDNDTSTLIFNKQGTWRFSKIDDNTILQGTYDGLYILKKANNKWSLRNKIEGFNNSSKYFVKYDAHQFFVNHEYKGVFKITLDKEYTKVVSLSKEESLTKGLHSSLVSYLDKILYTSKKGVFLYDREKDVFKRDTVYSQLISEEDFISGELIFSKQKNTLWSFSKNNIKYLRPGKLSNKPIVKSIPFSSAMPKAAYGYENIIHLGKDKYLIGTSSGYIIINLNRLEVNREFDLKINKINNFVLDQPKVKVDLTSKQDFLYKENNFEFFYSVPNYSKFIDIKYQYLLSGKSEQWSDLSDAESVLFENVSYGNYIFKVRAVVDGKILGKEASYHFTVGKPWYLSTTFVVLYIVLFLFAFYLVHAASKRYYRKQRVELLEKTNKESELRELENSQKLIKLNNEKLKSDIESKNRELATSTMNIIKKNDFLNMIKNELIKGDANSVSKVVKIIDRNLNNKDDWNMFQEAFNNADKNFLKIVKEKHPTLTPNDLRLCAYLRLNLTSKEIAPLLNISTRSVEVKRYRLRKKMELPHDSNLTNYILEL